MNAPNDGQVFDNLVYGQANDNPNPPTLTTPESSLLLGLLLVGMGGVRSVLKRK